MHELISTVEGIRSI